MDKKNKLMEKIDRDKIPRHIAIIMDGNGRWAKKHGYSRLRGHQEGVKSVREIVETAGHLRVDYLTLYAFSTENWRRPKREVHGVINLIRKTLLKEIDNLNKNNVVVQFIGSKNRLDKRFIEETENACAETKNNTGLTLTLAVNYGGRLEIIEAIRKLVLDIQQGKKIDVKDIDEHKFSNYLYTRDMPEVDLLIRTSGEQRLSNFLVWQSAYSEFWFTNTLWPDFRSEEFLQAIIDYQNRTRKFGGIG